MISMVVWYTNSLGKVIVVVLSIQDNLETALLRTHLSGSG